MRVHRLALLVCVAVVALGVACAQQEPVEPPAPPVPAWADEVLAVVDGKPVTRRQIWWEMEQGSGGEVLDDLVVGMLVANEAERQGVKVAGPEVDAELARLKADHDSEDAFAEMLQRRGQTLKGFRITIQRDLLIEKLLAKRMGVDEAGLQAYYDTHRDEFVRARKVHLYDIVALTLADAYAVRERLAAGEKFTAVASDVSHDPTSKQGGDRGWITRDDVLCEGVADVVFAMEMGEVSDPVVCEDHCHIFYAAAVKPRELLSFEEARPEIIRTLRQQRGISKEFYITLLKRAAKIDITWPTHSYMNEMLADLDRIKVVVDGVRLKLPRPAHILPSGNLVVPGAVILTAMGADISYDGDTGILEASSADARVRLVKGLGVLAAGDREVEMKETPIVEDGTMMISPRAPIEALGGSLLWNREENTLYVKSGAAVEDADAEAEAIDTGAVTVEEIEVN